MGGDFGVLQLEEQALLACDGVAGLGDFVAGPPDFDDVFADLDGVGAGVGFVFFLLAELGFLRRSTGEVGLMLPALSVREIRTVVLVDGQAEPALEAADVVLEEVGIFVEVDRFERQFAQTFAPVCICGGL